jgi:hypothetical protein
MSKYRKVVFHPPVLENSHKQFRRIGTYCQLLKATKLDSDVFNALMWELFNDGSLVIERRGNTQIIWYADIVIPGREPKPISEIIGFFSFLARAIFAKDTGAHMPELGTVQ